MKYPCKTCIAYAVCLNKHVINCDILHTVLRKAPDNWDFWQDMRKLFPKTHAIFPDSDYPWWKRYENTM